MMKSFLRMIMHLLITKEIKAFLQEIQRKSIIWSVKSSDLNPLEKYYTKF